MSHKIATHSRREKMVSLFHEKYITLRDKTEPRSLYHSVINLEELGIHHVKDTCRWKRYDRVIKLSDRVQGDIMKRNGPRTEP